MSDLAAVTDDGFEQQVLESGIPVLVDFWAEWCGPCKMLTPILEEVAPKYIGKVSFAKINIDDNPRTPVKYGVRGIPTLVLFKDGEEETRHVGLLSKQQLIEFLDKHA